MAWTTSATVGTLSLIFVTVFQVWPVNSLTVYKNTPEVFNLYRSTVKNVANLKRLGHGSTLVLALVEYLRLCDGVVSLPHGLHVGESNYYLNVMFTNDSKFNMVTSMVEFAKKGVDIFNHTSLVCPYKNPYCKAYYTIMNSKANMAECGYNYCPKQVRGRSYVYIYACAIGPKVGTYTDPKYPAYIVGPPCSHCAADEVCQNNLCTPKGSVSSTSAVSITTTISPSTTVTTKSSTTTKVSSTAASASSSTHSTSTGTHSTSTGTHSTSTGTHSTSTGTHSTSTGTHSTSTGTHSTSTGTHSDGKSSTSSTTYRHSSDASKSGSSDKTGAHPSHNTVPASGARVIVITDIYLFLSIFPLLQCLTF